MSKRRYTKMQVLLPTVEKMLESGMRHREIEAELGLEGDRPVHNLLKRQRRKAAKGAPKFRGRKPAKTVQEYKPVVRKRKPPRQRCLGGKQSRLYMLLECLFSGLCEIAYIFSWKPCFTCVQKRL